MPAPSHVDLGRYAELIAEAHFVRRGWSVFGAVSHHGISDLAVAHKNGRGCQIELIEVRYLDLNRGPQKRAVMLPNIKAFYVHADGEVECELTSKRTNPDADE